MSRVRGAPVLAHSTLSNADSVLLHLSFGISLTLVLTRRGHLKFKHDEFSEDKSMSGMFGFFCILAIGEESFCILAHAGGQFSTKAFGLHIFLEKDTWWHFYHKKERKMYGTVPYRGEHFWAYCQKESEKRENTPILVPAKYLF